MKFYIDLRTNQLMRSPGLPGAPTVQQIAFKRGRETTLQVQFLQDGNTPVKLAGIDNLVFACKPRGEYDVDPLVFSADWTIPLDDDADPTYTANPSFNTAALNALFAIDEDPANDVASVILMGELNWRSGSGPISSSTTFDLTVANDVWRDGEPTPTPLDPPDAYERQSNKGAVNGYAGLNGMQEVVGVPVQVTLGFPFAPDASEQDAALLIQDAVFAATGHFFRATGTPVPAPEFDLQADGVSIGAITVADGVNAFNIDAELTTSGTTLFTLVAPTEAIADPFSLAVSIKGLTA